MSLNKKSNYPVGYGKPPGKTRFEKGKSGNPAGRVRGSKNVSKLLLQALSEPVTVNENGERKRITKGEAMVKQLVNKGASGDARSILCVAKYNSSGGRGLKEAVAKRRRSHHKSVFSFVAQASACVPSFYRAAFR